MMNTEMPFYKESVRQIQVYLYDISRVDRDVPRVNPDGIYGSTTVEAVRAFQKKHGLDQSGRVDYATFRKLSAEHEKVDVILSSPRKLTPFGEELKGGVTGIGDESELVAIVKIMLRALSSSYPYGEELKIDGVFDSDTERAVKEFQFIHGLPSNGIINKETWNHLALAYEKHRVPL